ncbi:hypothetical protein EV363DRAFT_1202007 [Boletus edulis]|nr:hypothetical protein EV363DRAFT_1202007 [Boletus edulis]
MRCGYFKGTVMYLVSGWTFVVFISTADLVMILRVYSMWNRSRTILSILLFLYVTQTIITVVLDGIYDTPQYLCLGYVSHCMHRYNDWPYVTSTHQQITT